MQIAADCAGVSGAVDDRVEGEGGEDRVVVGVVEDSGVVG